MSHELVLLAVLFLLSEVECWRPPPRLYDAVESTWLMDENPLFTELDAENGIVDVEALAPQVQAQLGDTTAAASSEAASQTAKLVAPAEQRPSVSASALEADRSALAPQTFSPMEIPPPPPPPHTPAAARKDADACSEWCPMHASPWVEKCHYESRECAGCAACAAVAKQPILGPRCARWCSRHTDPWKIRCAWTTEGCILCPECVALSHGTSTTMSTPSVPLVLDLDAVRVPTDMPTDRPTDQPQGSAAPDTESVTESGVLGERMRASLREELAALRSKVEKLRAAKLSDKHV